MKKKHALIIILIAWLPWLIAAWDKDKPAATTTLRTSNPQILANQAALETAIGANHEFSTGGTNSGKHTTIVMQEQSSVTTAANEMGFYCKDLGAAPGIYVRPQSDGTAIQWSDGSAKIVNAAMAADSIDSAQYVDASIDLAHLSVNSIDSDQYVDNSIDPAHLVDDFTFDTFPLSPSAAPDANYELANKKYVDDHVGHDGDGYVLRDVDGTPTKVYTKYLTGTLDADSETIVAHGVTVANILHVSAICYDDNTGAYVVGDYSAAEYTNHDFKLRYGTSSITITGVGSYLQGNAYRIKIDYTA